ncbi:Fic family protein [Colwellia sp. KU-HH00111]|uniref:type II toxin-antitoxin system death-on-curing family toxin n=1 Tax=Colwellia sp. KU-HH00111 TaxID=3127652 RepID=UPI003365AB5B
MNKAEATPLFAQEREDGLAAIWGALDQTVFGESAYPNIESKAAHLLYFMVKNHPFSDGNKRTAAFLFVDFLNRNERLMNEQYQPVINYTGSPPHYIEEVKMPRYPNSQKHCSSL